MDHTLNVATKELRRPFTSAAVKVKVQSTKKDGSAAQAAFYIDARLVVERLNAVVGLDAWSTENRVLFEANPGAHRDFHFPIECRLTVCGVTKGDVGVYQKNSSDALTMKAAYSDALKRAAVNFGIGASLYAIPKVWVEGNGLKRNQEGKITGFSAAGEKLLRTRYELFLKSEECLKLFGAPLDHGDVADPDLSPSSGEEVKAEEGQPASPKEAAPADPSITKASPAQKRLITVRRGELKALRPDHPILERKVVTLDEASSLIDDLNFAIEDAGNTPDPTAEPELPVEASSLEAALAGGTTPLDDIEF